MLGVLGVMALVLGGFTAGGGAFDWEFLFSDGYREHGWVRSVGRDGARGLLILLGSVLGIAGFVSQVVDAASKPVPAVVANEPVPAVDGESLPDSDASESAFRMNSDNGNTVSGPSVAGPTIGQTGIAPAGSSAGIKNRSSKEPANGSSPGQPGLQPVTIWNPDVVPQDNQTQLILQYRFEPGHRPLAGSQYIWIVNLLSGTTEVIYDAASLEKKGQLTHIITTPRAGGGFDQEWSTRLEIETNGRRTPASNRLEITAEGVRSTPLTTPR